MKSFRIATFTIVFLSGVLFFAVTASACTIFTRHDREVVLAGNQEDWQYSYLSMYWIVQGENGDYGRVCFGISTYVQGGMNEKGLFYDGATCPRTQVPHDPDKAQLGMDAGEVVLSKCATVEEAVAFLENHNISASLGDHLLFADSSGGAVVVEWVNQEMRVIPAEQGRLIATNFHLTEPDLGGYPCERYIAAEEMLSGMQSLNVLGFSNILCSTTQDWGDGGTKYSNVYDLKDLAVYVYEKANFTQVAVIRLMEQLGQLAPGEKSKANIDSLDYHDTISLLGDEVVDFRQIN